MRDLYLPRVPLTCGTTNHCEDVILLGELPAKRQHLIETAAIPQRAEMRRAFALPHSPTLPISPTTLRMRSTRRSMSASPVIQPLENFCPNFVQLEPQIREHLGTCIVRIVQQTQKQVLSAHVLVVEVAGLLNGVVDDPSHPRLCVYARRDRLGAVYAELLHLEANAEQVDAEALEHFSTNTQPRLDDADEDMLAADDRRVETLGFLVGERHDDTSIIVELVQHREPT